MLGAKKLVESRGELGDVSVLYVDETGGHLGGWLVDLFFQIDELADERGVFGDDNGGRVGYGGDGAEGTELADDLGEGADRLIWFNVVEVHYVGDHRVALGKGIVLGEDGDAAAGGFKAGGGECKDVEARIGGVRDENEVLDGGGLAQKLRCLGVGEGILGRGWLDEGKLGLGCRGGNNDPAAGVAAVESREVVAGELGLLDGLDDQRVPEFAAGRNGGGCARSDHWRWDQDSRDGGLLFRGPRIGWRSWLLLILCGGYCRNKTC